MPRTLSFPPPSTATCPICSAPLSDPRCGGCGAAFVGEDGATLWRVDHDLFDLCRIRNDVVRRLLAAAATPSVAAPPSWGSAPAGRTDPTADPSVVRFPSPAPGPDGGPGQAPATPPAGPGGPPSSPPRPRPSFTAAEVLVGLGALSLVVAVVVFAAVAWSDLAAWAQGGLVVGLTGAVLGAAVAGRRRDLVATSESLGAVGVALGLADVQVARVGLDGVAPDRWVGAVGVALVAAGSIALGRRSGIRVLALSGRALAFAPLVVATSGGRPLAAVAVLAGQAGLGGIVAARRADLPSDRVVAGVGAALSWGGAVVGALGLAAAGLVATPVAHPVGPAVVLAALAAVTIAAARRGGEDAVVGSDLVGGCGAALALVPAVLLALGSGSALVVLAVVATQGVLALGAPGSGRASPGERVTVAVGGAVCWAGAVTGLLALGVDGLVDGDPVAGPALVLAALALGSIAAGRIRPARATLAAAGTAVAFGPGLLVAAGTGSVVTVLAVAAVQAVAAAAVAGRLTASETPVAEAGGAICWVGAAAGSLVHAVIEIAAVPDDPRPRIGALLVLGGLAAASVVVGRSTARRELTPAGAGLAFVPLPLAVLGVVSPSVLIAVLLGEALAAGLLATVVGRGPVRTALVAGGVTAWTVAVVGAGTLGLAGWLAAPARGPAGAVALLVALAAVAVGTSLRSGWGATATGVGLGAAVVPLLLAVALAVGGLGPDGWVAAVLAGTAVVALGLGVVGRIDDRRPWAAPSGVAVVAGAVLAVVPARTVLAVGAALADRAAWDPDVGGSAVVADWLRPALDATGSAVPGWAVVAQVAGAAALAGSVALRHRRAGRVLGALVAVGAVVVVPVAIGLTVAVTVAGLGLAVVGGAAVVRSRPRDPELLVGVAATALTGTAFAVGATPWTVGWTAVVGAVGAGLAVEAAARRSTDAPVWVGTAIGVVLAGVGLDAWVLGAPGVDGLLAVAVAGAVLSPAAVLLERRGLDLAADVVDTLTALVLVLAPCVAVTTTGAVDSLSPFLALVGVTAAGAALRPRRRSAWLVATGSAVLLAWVELGRAEVAVVEAYTLPLAAWALLVGAVAGRGTGRRAGRGAGRSLGSWERFGVGLLTAAGPTTVLAVIDPGPGRVVGVVALGAAVAIWGAAARLQAPLAVGAAAVALLAVRHLGPVGAEMPRYVAFALAGLVLLAVGATFEQRRQDLRHARDAFVRLR